MNLSWIRDTMSLRQPPAGPETVFLGLGSNISDRLYYLNKAVRALHAHVDIVVDDISAVYETDPIGPSEDPFYNVAARVHTTLAPLTLLRACQAVEAGLGRVRTIRWGPRTIDIDMLLYGDRTLSTGTLTVPHAELGNRAFALVPLLEVATGWHLPDGTTIAQAVARVAPIEGITGIGRQVSLEPLPDGPPIVGNPARPVAWDEGS